MHLCLFILLTKGQAIIQNFAGEKQLQVKNQKHTIRNFIQRAIFQWWNKQIICVNCVNFEAGAQVNLLSLTVWRKRENKKSEALHSVKLDHYDKLMVPVPKSSRSLYQAGPLFQVLLISSTEQRLLLSRSGLWTSIL